MTRQIKGNTCDILEEAVRRYRDLIFYPPRGSGTAKRFLKLSKKYSHTWELNEHFRGYLDNVVLQVLQPCENFPSLNMDEHCKIKLMRRD